jgi:hypothetical protein
MEAVTMPATMNVTTAAKDRIERRGMPQTPWPLVQPLARRVPTPTRRAATIVRGTAVVSLRG